MPALIRIHTKQSGASGARFDRGGGLTAPVGASAALAPIGAQGGQDASGLLARAIASSLLAARAGG